MNQGRVKFDILNSESQKLTKLCNLVKIYTVFNYFDDSFDKLGLSFVMINSGKVRVVFGQIFVGPNFDLSLSIDTY